MAARHMALQTVLPIVQVILAILLAAGILLQQRGAGLGSVFGNDMSETYYTRRGAELVIFRSTIVIAILFVASCLASLF